MTVDDLNKTSESNNLETCGVDLSNVDNSYYFDFIEAEETFVVPMDGTYSLEAWGASGGGKFHIVRASFGGGNDMSYVKGGYGGYSYNEVDLKAGDVLYINVGGVGPYSTNDVNLRIPGGYNGGGMSNYHTGGGGGATHIALSSGPIYGIDAEDILIVAGGGGGASEGWYCVGSADAAWTDGGYSIQGRNGGGNCESYGRVCNGSGTYGKNDGLGAGGGLFTSNGTPYNYVFKPYDWGGYTWYYQCQYDLKDAVTGGTGYIGNVRARNGIMYSYNGVADAGTYTKTISTQNVSTEPVAAYAKDGNGFARITYLGKKGDNKNFDYKGSEVTYTIPKTARYKLEVWGASGGGSSSTGGYASGDIDLNEGDILYINVGGQGQKQSLGVNEKPGGYNGGGGGGRAGYDAGGGGSGGGATSIATTSGLLSTLGNNRESILIVAGGGGGDVGNTIDHTGGNGGGFKGQNGYTSKNTGFSTGGSQTSGYAFGLGSTGANGGGNTGHNQGNGGSGGGFYGGVTNEDGSLGYSSGAGGSGYIGNSRLTNKVMYCNGCEESNETSTKTVSTYCYDNNPRSNCAKSGNGYARITLLDE